jgi:multiple sugar transport system substrate-binding protein
MNSPGVNWDMAPHPVWKEYPTKAPIPQTDSIVAITSVSKNKDAAFDVLTYMFSDEFQMKMSKSGDVSVLTDKKIQQAFASDIPDLKGKNLQAYFVLTPQEYAKNYDPLDKLYSYNSTGASLMSKDINTVLREAAEKHRMKIEEYKSKN